MNSVKVHWCNIKNFGDALNPYIITKLSGLPVVYRNYKNPNYYKELRSLIKSIVTFKKYDFNRLKPYDKNEKVVLGIGSLLDRSRENFEVWGSGYMNNFEQAEGGKFLAVRGKYSAEKLRSEGFDSCNIYGDAGLLLPLIYNPEVSKKYKVGLIPHLKDYNYFNEKYKNNPDVLVIDLKTKNIELVIDKILSCRNIFSTSLHGVIVAQAYDIPTLWIKHNDINTDGIKFYDYLDSVGIEIYDGFENYEELIFETEITFKKYSELTLIKNDLVFIQNGLLSVAPFPIKNEYMEKVNAG